MQYQVVDNVTGKKFMFEGDQPPTEDDVHKQLGTTPQVQTAQTQQWKPTTITDDLSSLPIVGPMVRQLTNYAKDVGTGWGQMLEPGTQQAQSDALVMAERARQRAAQPGTPMTTKLNLLKVAGDTANTVGEGAQQQVSQYSPDIDQPYLKRGFQTAGNIVTIAEIPAAVSSIIKNAPGVIKNIKNLNPYKGLPARMESLAARSKGSIPAKDFIEAFKRNVQKMHDPNATIDAAGNWKWADLDIEDYVNKVEDYINQGPDIITPTKLLELRKFFGNKLPQGIFQKAMMGRTPATNVADAARCVSTQTAKDITPGLAGTDWLYSRLKGILGPNELSALGRVGMVVGVPTVYKMIQNLLSGGSENPMQSTP